MAVKRKYRLNLRNYGNLPAIMLSQYDEGYALEFEIRDGTEAASDLSAYTVTLKGTRADTLAYSFAGTISTNVLTFVIDTTMTACAGRGTAEIAIKDTANDVLFATFNMPVFVERAAVPEGSIDADVERAQEIAEQVQEIVDNAAAAVSGAAEKWATGQIDGTDVPSTDPTYENNAKYYAEQAADAAASIGIDATLTQSGKAADAKKAGDEITALKEYLNNLYETLNLNLIANSYWTVSGSPIGAPVAYDGWSRTDRLPCVPGETIKITGTVKSQYNIFFNTDTDGDINTTFTVQVGDNDFIVPDGAHYYALSNTAAGMQNTVVKQFFDVDNVATRAEVTQLENAVTENKENVDAVFTMTNLYKTVDFTGLTTGYFVHSSGVLSENAAFNMLDGVSLKQGQTIHIRLRGTATVATLAESLGNDQYTPLLIGQGGTTVSDQEYTAQRDMIVAISFSKTYEYSAYIFTDTTSGTSNDAVFYCTPETGFYDALDRISANTSSGLRTLYVLPGEYDLYAELGGDTYAEGCIPDSSYNPPAAAWKHFSKVCPDRLKIVGLGEVVLKFNIPARTWPTGAIPNSVLSPISLRYGCEIENIKIVCSNTRYGIHIEGSGETSYRNVRYILKNVSVLYTLTDNGYASAIGCGLNDGTSLEIEDCVLKVVGSTGNGVKGHLNDGSANVYINDSFINAPTSSFNVEYNIKGEDSRFRFVNDALDDIIMSNGNLANTPFTITYEMVRTDATMKRPSDTSITMPTIVNYGSNLTIDEWS